MKSQHMLWYAAAVVVGVVAAISLGAPTSMVLLALVLLVCPVMMMFMMGGMGGMGGGHGHGSDQDSRTTDDHRDSAGRS
jgi:hypothetical protein